MVDHDAIDRLIEALQPLVSDRNGREYARRLGVSSGTVSRWLEGTSFPNGENASKVATSLGMTLSEFQERIVEGKSGEPISPVEAAAKIIKTLSRRDLGYILRVVSDCLDKDE